MYKVVYVVDMHTGRIVNTLIHPQVKIVMHVDDRHSRAVVNDMEGLLSKPFRNSFHGGTQASCFVPDNNLNLVNPTFK